MNGSKARELRQAARRYVESVGGGGEHAERFTAMVYTRMKKIFKAAKKTGAA